jgi:hypothetical protein
MHLIHQRCILLPSQTAVHSLPEAILYSAGSLLGAQGWELEVELYTAGSLSNIPVGTYSSSVRDFGYSGVVSLVHHWYSASEIRT